MRIFSDRCKYFSSVGIVTHSLLILTAGATFMFICYRNTKDVIIDGSPTFPDLYIDYSSFSDLIQIAAWCEFIIFFLGLVAASFKKPWSALLFLMFGIVGAHLTMQASQRTLALTKQVDDIFDKICQQSNDKVK